GRRRGRVGVAGAHARIIIEAAAAGIVGRDGKRRQRHAGRQRGCERGNQFLLVLHYCPPHWVRAKGAYVTYAAVPAVVQMIGGLIRNSLMTDRAHEPTPGRLPFSTEHRPWPVPRSSWVLHQVWNHVIFL